MSLSIANAINAIKQDEQWLKKIIIGGLAIFVLPYLLGIILGVMGGEEPSFVMSAVAYGLSLILGIYAHGFVVTAAHRYMSSDILKMPNWFEKGLMTVGGKAFVGSVAWMCLIYLAGLLVTFAVAGIGAIVFGLLYVLLAVLLKLNYIVVIVLVSILAVVVLSIVFLYVAQLFNTALACFLKTLRFEELFDFAKHIKIIKENKHTNWTLIGKQVLLFLLYFLAVIALCVTIVGILLIPCLYFAFYIAYYNLLVLYAKEIQIEKYI